MTLDQQIAAVAREIAMRKGVYPKWVAAKKMKQEKADHEIAAMEAVIVTLNQLQLIVPLSVHAQPAPWRFASHDAREADTTWVGVTRADGKLIFDSCNSEALGIESRQDEGETVFEDLAAERNLAFVCALRNAFEQFAPQEKQRAPAWPFPTGPMP